MTQKEYIKTHPEQFKDDIDKWLFTEFGIIGGCCSAEKSHEYVVARMVVERYEQNRLVHCDELTPEQAQNKMTGELYEDVKIVHEAICDLHSMVGTLEEECLLRDEGKVASGLFMHINNLKREMEKVVSKSERMLRKADIDQFGPLSKYVRPYLGY